jgi:uncharacterized protein (TIGR03437 family)
LPREFPRNASEEENIMRVSISLAVVAILAQAAVGQQISTVAGNGQSGFSGDGGSATDASLDGLSALAVDVDGNIYIADTSQVRVRKISASGVITTVAGNGQLGPRPRDLNTEGQPATSVSLGLIRGVATDSNGILYIADQHALRRVESSGALTTVVGLAPLYANNVPASKTAAGAIFALAFDAAGNLFYTDIGVVRKLDTSGIVTTVAGTFGAAGSSGDGGPATSATLNNPEAITIDRDGNLYIYERGSQRIRKVAADGIISTLVGANGPGFSGDNGPAPQAKIMDATGLTTDASGNLYFSDTRNQRIRRITPAGTITTIAGTGSVGFSGDNGPATAAKLYAPAGLAIDSANNLYVGDGYNRRIRKITPAGAGKQPQIAAGGVVNAASFKKEVSPGSLTTIFGTDLAGGIAAPDRLPLPTTLGAVSVNIGGIQAPLIYVSPTQINLQVPYEIPIGPAPVVVTANGVNSVAGAVLVTGEAPGILTYGENHAAAQNQDDSLNDQTHPAKAGSVLVVYLTGASRVTNAPASGAASPSSPLASLVSVPTVTVGGKKANLLFAGLAPGFVGLMQVNLTVPAMTAGNYPLVVTIGATASNAAIVTVR